MIDVDRGTAAYEVLRSVRPLHLHSARIVTATLAGTPVTLGIRAVLERLLEHGPQTVPELARALSLARQQVQRLVDVAREEGYVERRPNPGHARSKLIALTAEGRGVFERLHRQELVDMAEVAADLDPVELRRCAETLARLTEAVSRRGG